MRNTFIPDQTYCLSIDDMLAKFAGKLPDDFKFYGIGWYYVGNYSILMGHAEDKDIFEFYIYDARDPMSEFSWAFSALVRFDNSSVDS